MSSCLILNLQTDPLPVIEITMNSRLHQVQNWPELARQANWSVVLLAKNCRVSVRTLENYIHEKFGVCPLAWLFERRQQLALELLRDGSSVKETAMTLGYKYPTHFSRDFRKRWGQAPSAVSTRTKGPSVKRFTDGG